LASALAFGLTAGMFAHGHQGAQALRKYGFVAKFVHGKIPPMNTIHKKRHAFCQMGVLIGEFSNFVTI
jgi:hypothetical protein